MIDDNTFNIIVTRLSISHRIALQIKRLSVKQFSGLYFVNVLIT